MQTRGGLTLVLGAAALFMALGACSGRSAATSGVDVRTRAAASALPSVADQHAPAGMISAADEAGNFVGFVRQSDVMMPAKQFMETVNARTMWPVTDASGSVVGYVAPDVPFVPLATTQEPGFDIEKVRAARHGGCEDQIGRPSIRQEFPLCNDGMSSQ